MGLQNHKEKWITYCITYNKLKDLQFLPISMSLYKHCVGLIYVTFRHLVDETYQTNASVCFVVLCSVRFESTVRILHVVLVLSLLWFIKNNDVKVL